MDEVKSQLPPTKVLVLSPWKHRWSLGAGAGVSDDHRFIEKLTRSGFELHFLVPRSHENADLRVEGLFIHTYPNFFDATNALPVAVKRLLWPFCFNLFVTTRALLIGASLRPDFILGHSHYSSFAAYVCRELLRVPSAVKLFGVMDLVHTEWSRRRYYFKNIEQIMALKIPQDAWIILDDGTHGDQAAIRHGVAKEKIHFLPNGIDLDWADSAFDRAGMRHELGIRSDALVVLFLARLVASKRPQMLISAIPRIPSSHQTPAVFLFVGEGPEREKCEQLAARIGVAANTMFIGAVPHVRVPEIMAAADIFVSTSHLTNAALPTCEALLCGLPVVAFDTGNTRDVVRTGETGTVVPDGDIDALAAAMDTLLRDTEQRSKMSEAARRFAKARFTGWDERTNQEVDIIRSIVAGQPGPAGQKKAGG